MISELAMQSGVKVSTVRFYERAGLLPAPHRSANGYREFDKDDARHVRFLRRGQELGFTLTELGAFASLTGGAAPASVVTEHAQSKIDDIDRRIVDLQRTRSALLVVAARPVVDPGSICPVVDALGGATPASLSSDTAG
ncbi:MerR family DNA-binding transcriptional regulator [Microbacterium sp.]|uniref:MerR family DNA-binding transcriptional regulator n=1 Tax=Microbacterium sp. TaxID=51671 RepID=UPI003569586F